MGDDIAWDYLSDFDGLDEETKEAARAASFIDELWAIARVADPTITHERFVQNVLKAFDQVEKENMTTKVDHTHPAFKEFLTEALNAGRVSITFRKVSGNKDIRVMLCTTNAAELSEDQNTNGKAGGGTPPATGEERTDSIRVWDLEKHGWRSFRWDSIISYCLED